MICRPSRDSSHAADTGNRTGFRSGARASGTVIAAARGAAPALNIPAGLITAYLVVTGLTTVRPLPPTLRWVNHLAMILALGVGLVSCAFGIEAVAAGGTRKGMPAFPFFMFGTIGVLASIGDLRLMRTGALRGTSRIARHLWRMSLALFIAAMSFFIGQADEIPKPYRIMPLLALPPLTVLVTMLYWIWRIRLRGILQGVVIARVRADHSNGERTTEISAPPIG